MSRIGRKPIEIPEGVTVTIDGQQVKVEGPKGKLESMINDLVSVSLTEEEGKKVVGVSVKQPEDKTERSLWGTSRTVIQNMVQGVTEGYSKSLEVVGVGYKVNAQGKDLKIEVGYSHPVIFNIPEGIEASVDKNTITIAGADKQQVGEISAQIRKIRKPEPYKGKGIRYSDEVVRRKAGKAAKAAE